MGSAPPVSIKSSPELPLQPEQSQEPVQETKTEAPLQEIQTNINREFQSLKPSQSLNLEKSKNETKIKKVKDIRSLQCLRDINLQNIENQEPIPELNNEELEDVSIFKKPIKELNPVMKKKLASDRIMISYQSKTENVISIVSSNLNETRTSLESRTKKCRVSKML